MKLSILVAAAGIAAAQMRASPVGAQSVDATIDRAVAAWAKVKTVKRHVRADGRQRDHRHERQVQGEYVQERPNRLAIRFTQPAAGEIVADGKVMWVYLPSSSPGQVVKRPATDRSAVPIDLTGQFLDSPRTKYDITPAARADGRRARGARPGARAEEGHGRASSPRRPSGSTMMILSFENSKCPTRTA